MSIILPVIHHLDDKTTVAQSLLALECGAHGVFLISHGGNDGALAPLGASIKGRWAQTGMRASNGRPPFLGINLLNTNACTAIDHARTFGLDGVWIDAPGVSSSGLSPAGRRLVDKAHQHPSLEVFACVAFKYQPEEPDPAQAAKVAADHGFIPTTSGSATGEAPSTAKIALMRQASSNHQLAVASGMTPQNIAAYAGLATHILVATGVSQDEHHIDERLLKQLIANARSPGSY